ncbi:MAG: uridine monophosphate kinase [candidate division WOR-3 bacterium]|nr:uridine monophosphate kinase [candidate division WOR-3 bacterium]
MSVSVLVSKDRIKYKKILLKISGEILGQNNEVLSSRILDYIAEQVSSVHELGVKVAVVMGGGNIVRGKEVSWLSPIDADLCGMIGTVINGIALYSVLRKKIDKVYLRSSFEISGFVESFHKLEDRMIYDQGGVILLAGGTGNPLFTTDTAAALRAVELSAQILIKGTKVEGVYSADPEKDKDAKFYQRVSFREAIDKNLEVMDITAFKICRDAKIPICVYNLMKHPLKKIVLGEEVGTIVF